MRRWGDPGSTQGSGMGMSGMGSYGGGYGSLPMGSSGGGTPAYAAVLSVHFSKDGGDGAEDIRALLVRLWTRYKLSVASGV